jgi:hypothetical protein
MNNFDIEDAVLIMLKKLFYQNVFIRIGNPMLYKFYRTYNPLVLSKYIRFRDFRKLPDQLLEDLPSQGTLPTH